MKTTRGRGEEITDEMVLSRLVSGEKITLTRLSSRLKMSDDKVRRKLLQMVHQGKVKQEREGASMTTPYLYFVDSAPIADGAFEIPTPFVGVNLTGNLTGYDASFTRMRDLCMSIRRAA